MPKLNTKKRTMKKRTMKKRTMKNTKKGGADFGEGPNIPNYALNTLNTDPNYMQISSRNIVQQGSGKKKMKAGGLFDTVANQFSNPISDFFSYTKNSMDSSPAYIQPIGTYKYTGAEVNK
jgi:hypothetical protein